MDPFMRHLDTCKDVCDHFGIVTILTPYQSNGKITGFTIKSFRNPNNKENDYVFNYDPFWDDDDVVDYSGIDDELDGGEMAQQNLPEIVNEIPDDDEQIIDLTKNWVSKLMYDCGVCPFTRGSDLAGLPLGKVFYCVDRCTSTEDMYARYWKEVVRVADSTEKDLSTTLLITPEFYMDNIDIFESFSNTLTQPLTTLGVESLLQLVFFHPYWTFRDGGFRSGLGAAANYARRSPWPMINILRTSQVRAAQKGIPTGLVYTQNEKMLNEIGTDKLEKMLRLRDWQDISDIKVNRRDMEALRVAQDYQETGVLKTEDTSFTSDSTPAANKVDSGEIEQANLVNVIQDALEKRLGLEGDGKVKPLSGPETSAAIMATDFLLSELNKIVESGREEASSEAHRALMNDVMDGDNNNETADAVL